ncbi:MAG: hypothetical protein OCD76_06890 [Reichenbachiella sp.]
MKHVYKNNEIGIGDESIALLRNNYSYKRISYSEISSVEVVRGWYLKNRVLLFGLMCITIYYATVIFVKVVKVFLEFESESAMFIIYGGIASYLLGYVGLWLIGKSFFKRCSYIVLVLNSNNVVKKSLYQLDSNIDDILKCIYTKNSKIKFLNWS